MYNCWTRIRAGVDLAFLPGVGTRRGRTDIMNNRLLTIEAVRHKAADTSFHNGTVYVNLYQNAATDS
jgi:hypothetical protein